MEDFISFLIEAKGSGYDDEHALVNVWNHAVSHPEDARLLSHPKHLHAEIEKAKSDPTHPLNFANQTEGFTSGKKPEHETAYYNELHHAANAVVGMANHPSFKTAVKKKMKAKVAGASRGALSAIWKKHGAKNATSKADVTIGEGKGSIGVSLKKGDAQLMSAESNELRATYEHAANRHAQENPAFTEEHKRDVNTTIDQIGKHMEAMKGADRATQIAHRDAAQKLADGLHSRHPGLMKHVAYEAATGEGKFGGAGSSGSASVLISTHKDGMPHIHDVNTNREPIEVKPRLRISLPKGKGRSGNAKLDYTAKRAKEA